MGTDCYIKVDNEYFRLDRWYVFSPCIESTEKMTKSIALRKLRDLMRNKKLIKETKLWDERQSEFIKYHQHWLKEARKIIKENKAKVVIFYNEHDLPEEYFESKYGLFGY